jgi:hypothetical protein
METNCEALFYYPLPARTSFVALNCNVTVSRNGRSAGNEALHAADTRTLRSMLVACDELREVMRWSLLRCKYQRNVSFAHADGGCTLAQRDAFMDWAEALYDRELHAIAQEDARASGMPRGAPNASGTPGAESESLRARAFPNKPRAITRLCMAAHRKVRTAALAYAKQLLATMQWIQTRAEFCSWWTTTHRRASPDDADSKPQTHSTAVPLNDLVARGVMPGSGNVSQHQPDSDGTICVPVFRWLGSSSLAHRRSSPAMIETAFTYDYIMSMAVVLFADLNMAEASARLLCAEARTLDPTSTSTLFRRASHTCARVLMLVEQWFAAPTLCRRHAELQPFVLRALCEFCLARHIYYASNLHEALLSPAEFVDEFADQCTPIATTAATSGNKNTKAVTSGALLLSCARLRNLVRYNLHLCKALAHYNQQLLDNVEFGCFIHTLSCVALSRIAYVQIMLRSIQCLGARDGVSTAERAVFARSVLGPYTKRIETQKSMLEAKCRALRVWSAAVDKHVVCVRAVPGAAPSVIKRRPSIVGYHPSFVDVRRLYAVCSAVWSLLHKCQMHIELSEQM